jgi:nicotinamidase-related amidase
MPVSKRKARSRLCNRLYGLVCVSTTARADAELCYDVVIAEDAVGNRDIPGAKAVEVVSMVMNELGDALGTVLKSSSIN